MGSEDIKALFLAHQSALVSYAADILDDPGHAEDVVQEAFLRFRDAASARFLDEPTGYLYRIVRNLALDGRRRMSLEARYVRGSLDGVGEMAAVGPSPEVLASDREDLARVMEALADLPERTRIALEMHRFGGCRLREIADHLGVSVSMAQVLVMEGVRHCQRQLTGGVTADPSGCSGKGGTP